MQVNKLLSSNRRVELGQFMTPAPIARLMTSSIDVTRDEIRLVDPGAGVGSLTAAAVERILTSPTRPRRVILTAFEVEPLMHGALNTTLRLCRDALAAAGIECELRLRTEDFIEYALSDPEPEFDIAVINPPYRKLNTRSESYGRLRAAGIATPNLYAVFWAGAIAATAPGGQIITITPRSFCNGTYFKKFRQYLLEKTAIKWLHVFESRSKAFAEDDVLQENVITSAVRGACTTTVRLSRSRGLENEPTERVLAAADVVHEGDSEHFIRLPAEPKAQIVRDRMNRLPCDLKSLGLTVSTGRVVDFRVRDHLRRDPGPSTVPLIYPGHFGDDGLLQWPRPGFKKHNAIVRNDTTLRQLNTNGWYTLVRRFSAKEERRRVVAAIYDGSTDCDVLGFENHLNYYHQGGAPLESEVAKGLSVFLNSTLVDEYFRQFNGHTQVNAGDLRSLRYPERASLQKLAAEWKPGLTQDAIDQLVDSIEA
ncbi:N-6 DNA methylase [Micromonospora sp. NPDC023644]|uniref:Eco57I restriction-modification methylase domain-containing protein n=1 Tax=Micromonospora sp. NPDC023644 TaxID=3154321 RepID=UPI0033F2B191